MPNKKVSVIQTDTVSKEKRLREWNIIVKRILKKIEALKQERREEDGEEGGKPQKA